jgi:hypothetical protein
VLVDVDGVPGQRLDVLGLDVLGLDGARLGERHAADGAFVCGAVLTARRSLFVVDLFEFLVRLALDILAEGPDEVPAETVNEGRVALPALGNDVKQTRYQHADERKPPAKSDDPEDITRQQMAFGLRRGHRMQRLVGITGDRAILFVESRFPDWQTKGMFYVNQRLAVADSNRVLLVISISVDAGI